MSLCPDATVPVPVPERLEGRLLWSVAQDVNGYTVVTPSADSRVIYVSSSTGSDKNTGLSPTAPLATIAAGQKLVRNGMPDELLLKRGDVWHNQSFVSWQLSGRSAAEPVLIGAYGTGARPLVDSGTSGTGFQSQPGVNGAPVNFLDVIGVAFEPLDRDTTSSYYVAGAAGGTTGFRFYAAGGNVLVEDCSFQYYVNNIDVEAPAYSGGPVTSNITIRRTISSNSYSKSSHSQGLYALTVANLTVTQCVFDHNGWNTAVSGAGQQGYNHDIYCSSTCSGVVVNGCVLADASFAGIMARAGGDIDNNLFINDTVACTFGDADGADSKPGGVVGSLVGNVISGTGALGTDAYGQGFEIGNTKPGAGLLVANNTFTADSQFSSPAIILTMATATSTPAVCVGDNDVTIRNNVFNGFKYTLDIDGRFVPGGTGLYGLTDIKVLNNDFLNATGALVRDDGAVDPTQETFSGNRYYDPGLSTTSWVRLQSVSIGITAWLAAYDPTGVVLAALPYGDATRTVATYDAVLAGAGTNADFVANALQISPTNYRTQYMAQAAINYVQAGFVADVTPPTAAAATTTVNAALIGATAYTFTVAFGDDFKVNAASIAAADLLVTGPNGFSATPTLVSTAAATTRADGGQQVVATFTLAPPGGAWAAGADGTYAVSLVGGTLTDAAGNAAAGGTVGAFAVDLTPPTATAAAANVPASAAANTAYSFTVTYADASGIDPTSLTAMQVQVTDPTGVAQYAALAGAVVSTDGRSLTATYVITPPGGSWATATAGTYTVSLAAGVLDLAGNAAAANASLATFTVASAAAPTPAPATATLSGTAFVDANANGTFDGREVGLAGVTVFLDLAGTGKLAAGDPTATTAADGTYTFTGLAAGTYAVVAVPPAGYQATTAASASITVAAGGAAANVNFGQQVNPAAVNTGGNAPPTPVRRPVSINGSGLVRGATGAAAVAV